MDKDNVVQPAPVTIANNLEYPYLGHAETKRGPEPLEAVAVDGNVHTHDVVTGVDTVKRGPEPVEEPTPFDSETLRKIIVSPEIADALAAEGLQIDQDEVNRALDENQRRGELEAALSPVTSVEDLTRAFAANEIKDDAELVPVTPEAFHELKLGINASFEEVASLLLEHQRQISDIEARLEAHNRRGGHKI